MAMISVSTGLFAQSGRSARPGALPGYAYTVRITATPVAHGSASLPSPPDSQNYVGHASVAAGRGRLDIVEGGSQGMFQKGDYLLFDSSDVVVVHPAAHEFVPVSSETAAGAMQQLDAMGVKLTLSDERVTLDSLGPGDTVSGVPTRHYRMTVAFNMSMDAGVTQERLGTQSVTEYWTAAIPDMPPNPLLRANGLGGAAMPPTPMFAPLTARVDSAAARMGKTVALRTRGTTTMMLGPGATLETRETSDVTELRRTQVDLAALTLPGDYKPAGTPGQPANPTGADSADKWRRPPSVR